jgi:hypothetical protein
MQTEIERALVVLIGMPLWDAGRVVDMTWFQFGDRHIIPGQHEGTRVVGTYALHVQCAWRISDPSGIVVASDDRYFAPGDDPFEMEEGFDWTCPGANRCDERLTTFFADHVQEPLLVTGCYADDFGSVRLPLGDYITLEIFPASSLPNEYWRLFQPGSNTSHFVVTGNGIED